MEELLGSFFSCSEWFVLGSSCVVLAGFLPSSSSELLTSCFGSEVADFFDFLRVCSEWFVLRSSSLFLVGALEQMLQPCIGARNLLADFVLVLNGSCFGPLLYSSQELLSRFLDTICEQYRELDE